MPPEAGTAKRADGMPIGRPFAPGTSGNPGALSKYEREVRTAIQEQEPPAEVCKVIAAMKRDALAGKKHSPSAAKVYLAYTAGETKHLPDERLEKMVEERLQRLLEEAEARRGAS